MRVYLNQITGLADAMTSLYFTNHNWTHEREQKIYGICNGMLDENGFPKKECDLTEADKAEFNRLLKVVKNNGRRHITILRFVDIVVSIEGLHRAGQDDLDSHAMRMNNRIIRMSSRLGKDFKNVPLSEYYQDKVMTIDEAAELAGIELPETVTKDGIEYTKRINGYVRTDLVGTKDVERGLYPLGFASNCIFKVNLTEWSHIFKERNKNGGAHPELKDCVEMIQDQLEEAFPLFDREYLLSIIN